MRAISLTTALCLCSIHIACAPAEPPRAPTAATPTVKASPPPAVDPVTDPAPAPPVTAAATPEPAPSVPPPPLPDLVDSPGDTRLDQAVGFLKANQHLKARLALTRVLPDIDRSGSLDVKMAAHALLGRACISLSDAKCAAEQYGIVRAAWKDPDAAVKELDAAGGDDEAKDARRGRALNAVGEALFQAAEEKKHAAEKVRSPGYAGNADKASITKHVQTGLAAWAKERRALVEEATSAYSAVSKIQPFAPPRWVVVSSARAGAMWGRFVAEFRAAPVPRGWLGTGLLPGTNRTKQEVRADYYAAMDEAAAPHRAQAHAAFKTCQELSQKLGIQDDDSKMCDTWLAKSPAP